MPEDFKLKNFREFDLKHTYRTSSFRANGPVDILKEFYIPVLSRSLKYDRMAGYFTSSSLAAASQGFSAFTSLGGKLRLIVGSDLQIEDIQAVLDGDSQRLTHKLGNELEDMNIWPEETKRGVELLSWMVAHEYLEIRVAFRVSLVTGKPITYNSTEDGYVHEKWAIFYDTEGNRILASGSLNESERALQKNAENLDINAEWWNDVAKSKVDEAEEDFDLLWKDKVPHIKVFTLPQAIKEKLVRIGKAVRIPTEIDGTPGIEENPLLTSKEILQFLLIKEGPRLPGGQYVGMKTTPINPWPHQDIVARRLVETWPYSYLMCDEVGLGKTIEAGLALRSLILSGRVKRTMIAAPAGLTHQWHRELATKFYLPFGRACSGSSPKHEYLLPLEETRHSSSLYSPDLSIVSTGLVTQKHRQSAIKNASDFDIVLVDEAHYARRKDPAAKDGTRIDPKYGNLYKRIDGTIRDKTKSLWLATATPMQLNWIESYDLIRLTKRVGAFKDDPYLTDFYYQLLSNLVNNGDLDECQWSFLRKTVLSIQSQDPLLYEYLKTNLFNASFRTLIRRWLKNGYAPVGTGKLRSKKLLFSVAPLSRVMERHTRQLLKIYKEKGQLKANLAERTILPIPPLKFSSQEKQAYEELQDYCQELKKQIEQNCSDGNKRASIGFYLSFLRLRFASSLFAIRQTLRRRLVKVIATLENQLVHDTDFDWSDFDQEIDIPDERCLEDFLKDRTPADLEWEKSRLEEMLVNLEDLTKTPFKIQHLLSVLNSRRISHLDKRIQQTVIFTRFTDTLNDLVSRLRIVDPSMRIGIYSGKSCSYYDSSSKKMKGSNREEIKHRFLQGEIDVLICTDAAAEGLNLQTADLLINLDLPWNPMKLEQRIGRIDRIGQKYKEIYVLNLCYLGSAEEIVYGRLIKRLGEAMNVVGNMPFPLLPVTEEDFRELSAGEILPSELEIRALERLKLRQERTSSMEIPPEDLYQIYTNLNQNHRSPITLEDIWEALTSSTFLHDLGSYTKETSEGNIFIIKGILVVNDGTALTIDKDLFEKGCPDFDGPLHFATYGDPVFDALLDFILSEDHIPGSIKTIEVHSDKLNADVSGISVLTFEEDNKIKLITSWSDIQDLQIDDSSSFSKDEIVVLQQTLLQLAEERGPRLTAVINDRILKENERCASAHQILNLVVAHGLIRSMRTLGYSDEDNFWHCIGEIDQKLEGKKEHVVPELPKDPLELISEYLMIDFKIPAIGNTLSPNLPIHIIHSAIHAACREADAIREAKSRLQINTVRARIKRKIAVIAQESFGKQVYI